MTKTIHTNIHDDSSDKTACRKEWGNGPAKADNVTDDLRLVTCQDCLFEVERQEGVRQ